MTRKEMIVIAALVNAGVLSILFMTAGNLEDVQEIKNESIPQKLAFEEMSVPQKERERALNEPVSIPLYEEKVPVQETQTPIQSKESSLPEQASVDQDYVQVTVKRGDFLQKIAKANGTTVDAIKKANGLKNEKIAVGQVLKVPLKTTLPQDKEDVHPSQQKVPDGVIYYTIKSGDNPWKLARQFHVPFEELLRLNNLDEDKAKNLKIGDKIRVR